MIKERIRKLQKQVLSKNWYTLYKYSYEYLNDDNKWEKQKREAYDRGNGAAILLYNKHKGTVILTRQFRLPSYINGNSTGLLIEACAGHLEDQEPEDCIKKETEEKTGFKITKPKKVFECYMSPGSVTEILHFFVSEYTDEMKVNEGGGVDEEQEIIEVMELSFEKVYGMIANGQIKDAKTMLLLQHVNIKKLV